MKKELAVNAMICGWFPPWPLANGDYPPPVICGAAIPHSELEGAEIKPDLATLPLVSR